MNVIIADANLKQALTGIAQPVEVRTKDGTLLGHYTPVVDPRQAELHAKHSHLFDLKEVDRIAATERNEGLPLQEVWKQIR